jgi:Na+-translocating ferredoxin:NAD+ oxidoreductase RnfC subunit
MHRPRSLIAEELSACIRCNECLVACPALGEPLAIEALNNETLNGPLSPAVARFARGCYLCGACVPVCPVGLHRDSMMLWLKMRLLRGDTAVQNLSLVRPARQPKRVHREGTKDTEAEKQLRPPVYADGRSVASVHGQAHCAIAWAGDAGDGRRAAAPGAESRGGTRDERRRRHA